jgi:LuxR family maltose regulon positive regulatory protein
VGSEIIDVPRVMPAQDPGTASRLGFALAESKFHPPGDRPGIVVRAALVERLAGSRAPVITVAAPPGYGKTTLLAQWAERIGSRVAWLSCDDSDNDPVVLLGALAVALDRIGPVDPAIFSALASPGTDVTVVPRFVSAVASLPPPVTVLLDQAEAITNRQCLNTLAEFALRLPPGWQFALASRDAVPLPTARLRAQGGDTRGHCRRPGDGSAGSSVFAGTLGNRGRRDRPS